MKILYLFLTALSGLVLTIGLTLILFLFSLNFPGSPVLAGGTIRYVATTGSNVGNDCLDSDNPCATVQYGVDAANEGDEIRVAEGTYSGVFTHTVPNGYPVLSASILKQHLYLSKTVSLIGGYTLTNWTISEPELNPTVLDAEAQGRVIFVDSGVTPSIEGFQITGGDATGLEGSVWCCFFSADVGGGIYVLSTYIELHNDLVINNFGESGGGVYFHQGSGFAESNRIEENTGGGLEFYFSENATIVGNEIYNNTDYGIQAQANYIEVISNEIELNLGPGLYIQYGDADNITITTNLVMSNTSIGIGINANNAFISQNIISGNMGGGLSVTGANITVKENLIQKNLGFYGGGINASGINVHIEDNIISNNSATYGGGIATKDVVFENNVVINNVASEAGSGIYVEGANPKFFNTTIANNTGGDESGVHAEDYFFPGELIEVPSHITMTNTILISQTVGITVSTISTATLNGILWYSNGANTSGDGSITAQNEYTGNPAFAPDGYHLTANSAAIDKGIPTTVSTDIDGESRPYGPAPDLGADEFFIPTLPTEINLNGPTTGFVNTSYTFTATVSPLTTTLPITYIWQADDQNLITQTNGISDTVTFIWSTPGTKTITVTADNGFGTVNTTFTIEIAPTAYKIYLPIVTR